jgi:uncharacterized protein
MPRSLLALSVAFLALTSGCESNMAKPIDDARTVNPPQSARPSDESIRADAEKAFAANDDARALSLYLPLALKGDSFSQSRLGFIYKRNRGVPVNAAESCRWYEAAAMNDPHDGTSAVNLGVCYERGEGRNKSVADALRWYRVAADRGEPFGMFNLGIAYEFGFGVKQDFAAATRWFQRALDQKIEAFAASDARRHLKRCLNNVGAALGDPQALHDLAIDLFNGHAPELKDQRRALALMKDAAEKGSLPDAWYLYGAWLQMGMGGAGDEARAAAWIKKASDAGHEEAVIRYANMLKCGNGARKDLAAAEALLRQRVNAGNWRATAELSEWFVRGDCGFRKDVPLSASLRQQAEVARKNAGERLARERRAESP